MTTSKDITLENWTEESACAYCIEYLKKIADGTVRTDGGTFHFNAKGILATFLGEQGIRAGSNEALTATARISGPLMSALWQLSLRAVIRPSISHLNNTHCPESLPGTGYSLTEQGREWLKGNTDLLGLVTSRSYLKVLVFSGANGRIIPGEME